MVSPYDNLNKKMSINGGYQFRHNTNLDAMQRNDIPQSLGASVLKMNLDQ